MAEYSPLTCYICGEVKDEVAEDKEGCLSDQEYASDRFEEKFDRRPEYLLFICQTCQEDNPHHTRNAKKKYGVVGRDI